MVTEAAIKDYLEEGREQEGGEEMIVVKRMEFDAAHFLPGYPGKCADMHGHRFVVELGVKGRVGEDGMVIDFAELKKFLDVEKNTFDHRVLNDIIPNPTAENICLYLKKDFNIFDWGNVKLEFIQVWETGDSYAEWRSKDGG